MYAIRSYYEGEKALIRSGAAATDIKGTVRFTVSGFEQAVKLLEFRKYLTEIRRQNGDRSASGELWGDYLVFATMFGIGEQVLESMKALDPAYFDTFASMYGCNAYNMIYLVIMTNHISSAATPTQNTDVITSYSIHYTKLYERWLHTGGIYAALSEQSCETVIAAIKTAKRNNFV